MYFFFYKNFLRTVIVLLLCQSVRIVSKTTAQSGNENFALSNQVKLIQDQRLL